MTDFDPIPAKTPITGGPGQHQSGRLTTRVQCHRRSKGNYLATSLAVGPVDPAMSTFSVEVLIDNRNRGHSGEICRLLLTDERRRELIDALTSLE